MFDEIHTLFQPVVALPGGEPYAYEALSRGPSDQGLFDPRSLFIAAAEQHWLVDLDLRCMDLAIERGAEHGLHGNGAPALFINTLPDTLQAKDFARRLTDTIDRAGARPGGLILEVNEAWRIQEYGPVRAVLDELRATGIRLAVDAAGSGQSGLQVLAELRPDFVKIDRDLIRGVHNDDARAAILEMLARLGERLDIEPVAEGVEDGDELDVVEGLGIPYAQGFFIGRPGPDPVLAEDWRDGD